jgi:hypothetical protein
MRKTLFLAMALGVSAFASAQNANPPAGNSKPTDIDPAVNTSAPDQAPARETPRPQDVDPAVNTSSAAQTPTQSSTTPSTPARAAQPSTAAKPAGSATVPGTASGATGQATQNAPGSTKPKGKSLDRLELDTTQITGNRELPKVLYIVPWKRSDLGDLVGKPVNSLLDEVLTPVDRDVFKRENRYYRALTPAEGGNSPAPAAGTAAPASTSSGSGAPASRDER